MLSCFSKGGVANRGKMHLVTNNLPRDRVGPYRLVRLLGKGGMGAVYEAIQEPIERRVAIKILHGRYAQEPEIAARFFKEARAVNIVDHPGIVQISDYGQLPNGIAYLVMEYLKGETLTQRMKQSGGKLLLPEALRLGRQIAAALAAAHEKGIIHRDLKPDNVMLIIDTDPEAMGRVRAKLLDFGIAKLSAEVEKSNTNTAADVVMGTPKYMAPEQCRGAANVDDKSDVYALGVMLYEMLAGRVPFRGPTGEVLAKQIYEEPPRLSEIAPWVTPEVASLIHRLLNKTKAERPSMRQVVSELERMTARFPTMAHPVVPSPFLLSANKSDRPKSSSDPVDEDAATNPSLSLSGALEIVEEEPDSQPETPRHSTLGFSVGQSSLSMRSPSWRFRRWLVPTAAGLLVAASIVTAAALRQRSIPNKPLPAVAKPIKKKVYWSISTAPAGAEIYRVSDGQLLGKTPWHGEQEPSSGEASLRLSLSGYKDRIVTLRQSDDDHQEIKLDILPSEEASAIKPQPPKIKRPLVQHSPTTPKPTPPTNARPKLVD